MSHASTPRAFVLMPFAGEFDRTYNVLIKPALNGYDVARADTRLDERGILEKIVTGIRDADLIVADITDTNSNVMYELGISHSLGKPTILLTQNVAALPFDIRSYPVHEYSSDAAECMIGHLRQLAESYRLGLVAFANPVTDFASAELPLSPRFEPVIGYSPDDFAQDVVEGLQYMSGFGDRLDSISAAHIASLADAGSKFRSGQPWNELTILDHPGIRAAADTNRNFAQSLADIAGHFHDIWHRIARGMMWMLSPAVRHLVSSDARASYVRGSMLVDDQMNGIVGALADLRQVNAAFPGCSGNLTHSFEAVNGAITQMLNEIMTAKGYLARIRLAASQSV